MLLQKSDGDTVQKIEIRQNAAMKKSTRSYWRAMKRKCWKKLELSGQRELTNRCTTVKLITTLRISLNGWR